MKMMALCMALCLIVSCSYSGENTSRKDQFYGKWSGAGRLYNYKSNDKYGPVDITIEIHTDNSVSGTVGNAVIAECVIKKWRHSHMLEGKLKGELILNKDNIIILLDKKNGDEIGSDFHMKSNSFFDFTMEAGEVMLSRTQ